MAFARKLTPEQVAEIIQRRSTGEAYNKIAVDYDISGSRVYELTHPEIQAQKLEKTKAKNAEKRAAAKAAKAAEAGTAQEDLSDLDLSGVDSGPEGDLGSAEGEPVMEGEVVDVEVSDEELFPN